MSDDLALIGLGADTSGLKKGEHALDGLARKGRQAEKDIQKTTNNMERNFNRVKGAVIGFASVFVFRKAIGQLNSLRLEAQQFGNAIAEVSTLLNDTSNMAKYNKEAKNLAKTYGTMPEKQVKSFYTVISAGAEDAAEATATLTAANKLAIGGVTNIETAVDGLTSTLNAYNLEGDQATDVSDAFFVAMKAGKTTVGEISSSIGNVASIASSAGIAFDELLASVSAVTTGGVKTSVAMNSLRQVIVSVLKPTKEAQDLAKDLGLEFNAAALESQGLAGFIENVAEKTDGSVEKLSQLFGSVEALGSIIQLVGPQSETFANIMEEMEERAGQTETAYSKMAKEMQQQTNILSAQFAVLRLEIGEKLLESALPATKAINDNFDMLVNTITKGSTVIAAAVGGRVAAAFVGSATAKVKDTVATYNQAQATRVAAAAEIEFLRATQASLSAQLAANVGTSKAAALRRQLAANTSALTAATKTHNAALATTSIMARGAGVAMTGLRGVLALFGGPVGIAVTAAAAIWIFRDSLFGAEGGAKSLSAELDNTLNRMNAIKDVSVVSPLEEAVERSKEHLKSLKEEADTLREVYQIVKNDGKIIARDAMNQIAAKVDQIRALEDQIDLTDNLIKITKAGTRRMSSDYAMVAAQVEIFAEETDEVVTNTEKLLVAERNLKNNRTDLYNQVFDDAEEYANKLQDITDRIYPQQKAVRELTAEWAILYAHAKGNGNVMPKILRDWIDQNIKVKNTTREVSDEIKKLNGEAEPFGKIWETTIERVQGVFADMFYTILDQGKVTFDNLLDLFKRMVAEMAAKKIMLSFSSGNGGLSDILGSSGGAGGGGGFNLQTLSSLKNFTGGFTGAVETFGGYVNMLPESISSGFVQSGANLVSDAAFNQAVLEGGLQQGYNLNAGAGALATAGAGIAGGYVGNVVGEGLFDKQAESNYGSMAGGAVGAYIGAGASIGGPWGAAIGAFVGALVDVLGGGDGKKRSALGVQTNPAWQGADKDKSPIQIEAESGLLLTAYAKRAGDEASKTAKQLTEIFAATDSALTGIFGTLGKEVDLLNQSLDGINSEADSGESGSEGFFGSAGFNGGLSKEDLQNAPDDFVRAWVKKVNELNNTDVSLEPLFNLRKEHEALADVLIRVDDSFGPVNNMLEAIGLTAYETSVAGMVLSDGLSAAFGGLENMNSAITEYQKLAFSEEERMNKLRDSMSAAFERLGMVMPENIDGLRDIIEGLDRTTQHGKETFATLISIAPVFNEVAKAAKAAAEAERAAAIKGAREKLSLLEKEIKSEKSKLTENHNHRLELLDREKEALEQSISDARENINTVFAAFQRGIEQRRATIQEQAQLEIDAINSQRDAIISNYNMIASRIKDSMSPIQESIQRLERDANALKNAINAVSVGDVATTLARQQSGVESIKGGATGDNLERAIRFATSATAEMFSSRADFERTQSRAGHAISGRLESTESNLNTEKGRLAFFQERLNQAAVARDKQLEKLDEQIKVIAEHRDNMLEGLDQQVEIAQKQMDAVDGVKNNVATLSELTKAIATYEQTREMALLQISSIDRQRVEAQKRFDREIEFLNAEYEHNVVLLETAIKQGQDTNAILGISNTISGKLSTIAGLLDEEGSGGFASGGIASGPTSGYWERLHGTEAVVPLENGGGIPVNVRGNSNEDLIKEIRALKSEVVALKSEAGQIRNNTGDSASFQRKTYYADKVAAEG